MAEIAASYIFWAAVVLIACAAFILFWNEGGIRRFRKRAEVPEGFRRAPREPSANAAKPTTRVTWASLNARVGLKSKVAGVGFAVLTAVLLILSQLTQSIVFEIDSLVAFLAALVLLFSEPRRRVHGSLIDAILSSNEMSIADFAAKESDTYEYVPEARGVSGVVLTPQDHTGFRPDAESQVLRITPPGRALAELFAREAGVLDPTFESLEASLPQVVRENFGLASTVSLAREGDLIKVVLGKPSFECPCQNGGLAGKSGVVGCTVGSFVAVLVCTAEGLPLELNGCQRDGLSDTLEISMRLKLREGKQ